MKPIAPSFFPTVERKRRHPGVMHTQQWVREQQARKRVWRQSRQVVPIVLEGVKKGIFFIFTRFGYEDYWHEMISVRHRRFVKGGSLIDAQWQGAYMGDRLIRGEWRDSCSAVRIRTVGFGSFIRCDDRGRGSMYVLYCVPLPP